MVSDIITEIHEKMAFKGATFEQRKGEFENKEARLKKLWEKKLGYQLTELPEYETVFRVVKKAFREAGLL